MTQEDKKLLYKDLSARQPYRPFICFAGKITMPLLDVIASTKNNELMSINGLGLDNVKVYLRPMPSMTHDEDVEYRDIMESGHYDSPSQEYASIIDWLNEHHFDYRGLIEKRLALEAPEGMYKTE